MKKKISKKKGYTLLELSIVIALTGILSSIIMVNLNSGRTEQQVKAAQDEIASAVKLAQSFALQGRIQGGTIPKCYGVKGSGGSYEIYYDASSASCSSGAYPQVEVYNFSNGVLISGNFDFGFDVPHGNVKKGGGLRATVKKGTYPEKWVELNDGGAITKN